MSNKPLQEWIESTFGRGSYKKSVGGLVFASNKKFIAGIISGYFDGDGNMNVERQQIRVGSRSKELIHDIARLLAYCGIFGSFGEETAIPLGIDIKDFAKAKSETSQHQRFK